MSAASSIAATSPNSGAQNYGAWLQTKGYDVYVGGVTAYSTLGWFKDPVLNTFIFDPEPDLAETLFHELGHQRVFASGDTDFNEAFATTVGQEGARRWLRAKGDQAALEKYLAELRRTAQFARLIAEHARAVGDALRRRAHRGGQDQGDKEKRAVPPEQLRRQKQQLLDRLQQEYTQLKAQWGGDTEYDEWFARPVNNAQLNSVAAYYDLVPGFERLLEQNGGDLAKFYEAADRLTHEPKAERHRQLRLPERHRSRLDAPLNRSPVSWPSPTRCPTNTGAIPVPPAFPLLSPCFLHAIGPPSVGLLELTSRLMPSARSGRLELQ